MSERTVAATDGEVFTVRPLTDADASAVIAGFEHLSPESARRRFFSQSIQQVGRGFLTDLATPRADHVVLLALDGRDHLVGGARGILDPDRPGTAEVSVTVGDPWQGRGLGGALLRLLAADLRRVGVHRLAGHTQLENHRARALIAGSSGLLWVDEPGILGFEIPIGRGALPSEESLYRALHAAS